jgi:hypothetical protein
MRSFFVTSWGTTDRPQLARFGKLLDGGIFFWQLQLSTIVKQTSFTCEANTFK